MLAGVLGVVPVDVEHEGRGRRHRQHLNGGPPSHVRVHWEGSLPTLFPWYPLCARPRKLLGYILLPYIEIVLNIDEFLQKKFFVFLGFNFSMDPCPQPSGHTVLHCAVRKRIPRGGQISVVPLPHNCAGSIKLQIQISCGPSNRGTPPQEGIFGGHTLNETEIEFE